MTVSDIVAGMLREDGGFQKALRTTVEDELGMTFNEFCQVSGVSNSTMYKILEGGREPNLRTIRQIIKTIRILQTPEEGLFIAVIASATVLEDLPEEMELNGLKVSIHEYSVSTVEDAIIAAVRAERDGALGVVCAPIVAPTVEKILSIPVSRVIPTSSVNLAIDRLRDLV
ncbi:MAG: transcriptional regulator [Candidatus Methanomethylophilaceae archaeon]|nr:transcriptional regulator [Candidatus Methanomethylophilaceae archaeon]